MNERAAPRYKGRSRGAWCVARGSSFLGLGQFTNCPRPLPLPHLAAPLHTSTIAGFWHLLQSFPDHDLLGQVYHILGWEGKSPLGWFIEDGSLSCWSRRPACGTLQSGLGPVHGAS